MATKATPSKPKKAEIVPTFFAANGRRKEAVARVRLIPKGTGIITVNDKPSEEYFKGTMATARYTEPLRITETREMFDVSVRVVGSGLSSQIDAMIHGIARALEKVDREAYRPILKKRGFLTRDPRAKERRKAGFAQKARAKKSSPKR